MKFLIKLGITVICCSFLNSSLLVANEETNNSATLKEIMQDLLKDTQQISEGIFTDDIKLVEKSAQQIANHPKVPMDTRTKLAKAFGPEMGKFKGFDMTVHNTAIAIEKAAKANDMSSVVSNYHQLIDGCQSCHNNFKIRASEILK